jgi:hypothetical protein
MLLSELHGYKQYMGKSLRAIFADLCEKHGIRVASGAFGFVIKSSKPYVYKVWSDDKAWEDWLKWAKANPSKYIIKQLGPVRDLPFQFGDITAKDNTDGAKERAKKAAGKSVRLKYVKLEKLTPLRDSDLYDAIAIANRIVPSMVNKDMRYTVEELAYKIAKSSSLIEDDVLLNEKFFECYLDVARAVGKMGHTADMHTENIMMRDEMIPVITDPAKSDMSWEAISAPELVELFDTKMDKT